MAWGQGGGPGSGQHPGGFPNLKEMIAHDIESGAVFFNPDDFGELHRINGREILCCVIENTGSPFESTVSGRTVGRSVLDIERSGRKTYTNGVTIVVRCADYGDRPAIGAVLLLDDRRPLLIQEIAEDHGVFKITGTENKG